jgi:hypothetical protein
MYAVSYVFIKAFPTSQFIILTLLLQEQFVDEGSEIMPDLSRLHPCF